jgi:hypothetical protein
MQLIPNAKAQFIDSGGQPLANGSVGFYFPGTLNPKPTYQDAAGTIANTNPVLLDSRGQALIWGSGVYRQILKDASGVTIWDQTTEDPNAGLTGNITDAKFVAGTDFIPGTTTTLTLPVAPGASSNMWAFFDAGYQADDQYTVNGTTLTFNSPIPVGVQEVNVKIGTTVAVGTPGAGTVVDATVAANAGINANKISYLAPYAGSAARTQLSKDSDVVSVLDFPGIDPTGTNDSTTGMQAAHNTGKLIYYPTGVYKFSTLTMSAGGIIGDSSSLTKLFSTDTTSANVITFSAANLQPGTAAPRFEHFELMGTQPGKASGAGIIVTAPTSENQGAQFYDVTLYGFPNCLQFGAAAYWSILNSKFINYSGNGIVVQNTNNPDSGDSIIEGCQFITSVGTTPVAIAYQSSGGLKVIGNKINGGSYGIFLGLNASANTGDLLILGNSIENQAITGIELARSSGTANFGNVAIVGNQLAICGNGISADATGFLSNVTIVGNTIGLASGTGTAINLGAVSNFTIEGNVLIAGSTGETGIAIGSGCANGHVGTSNSYNGFSNSFSNSSASVFVGGKQTGTASVITSTAYGSQFFGSTTITFPTPYKLTPIVNTSPNTSSGLGVSAFASGVSTNGFTLNVVSNTNGGSIGTQWNSDGVI